VEDTSVYTTAAFKDCVFTNNTATTPKSENCQRQFSGTVGVQSHNDCGVGIVVTFENCTFTSNQGENVVLYADYVFSSTNLTIIDESAPLDCNANPYPEPDGECIPVNGTEREQEREKGFADSPDCLDLYDENFFTPCHPTNLENASRRLEDLPRSFVPLRRLQLLNTSSSVYQGIVKVGLIPWPY
jgi:hypothetical protein